MEGASSTDSGDITYMVEKVYSILSVSSIPFQNKVGRVSFLKMHYFINASF